MTVAALFLAAAIASGQTEDPAQAKFAKEQALNTAQTAALKAWPEVVLNALVLQKSGEPVPAAEASRLQLRVDGVAQPIELMGNGDAPVSLALLIDTSGSTYYFRSQMVESVTTLIKNLPAGSEVMAVHFADDPYLDLPFTEDRAVATGSSVGHLDARGATALLDAVVAAENYVATHAHHPKRAIVILSDGGDNTSKLPLAQAERKLAFPGAPVLYALKMPLKWSRNVALDELLKERKTLKALCKSTGCMVLDTQTDKPIGPTVERLSAMIRSQSVLKFTSVNAARNGKLHKVELRLDTPEPRIEVFGLPAFYAPAE